MLGPQGSGKGTQAERLCAFFGAPHIEIGEMIRAEIAAGTELGHDLQRYNDRGELVPDAIVLGAVKPLVAQARSWILDGFPRTMAQAETLDALLTGENADLDGVIGLEAPDDVLIARLAGRRYSEATGKLYHLTANPPPPDDPGPFVQRADDTPENIKRRLQIYHTETEPLMTYYAERGLLHRVNAAASVDDVYGAILTALLAID